MYRLYRPTRILKTDEFTHWLRRSIRLKISVNGFALTWPIFVCDMKSLFNLNHLITFDDISVFGWSAIDRRIVCLFTVNLCVVHVQEKIKRKRSCNICLNILFMHPEFIKVSIEFHICYLCLCVQYECNVMYVCSRNVWFYLMESCGTKRSRAVQHLVTRATVTVVTVQRRNTYIDWRRQSLYYAQHCTAVQADSSPLIRSDSAAGTHF